VRVSPQWGLCFWLSVFDTLESYCAMIVCVNYDFESCMYDLEFEINCGILCELHVRIMIELITCVCIFWELYSVMKLGVADEDFF